jgi:Arc/MetJ family transcription regulator
MVIHRRRTAMRTNIVLDEALVERARELTGIKTRRKLVDEALRSLIRERERLSLLDLKGKIRFAEGYDHRALREDRR